MQWSILQRRTSFRVDLGIPAYKKSCAALGLHRRLPDGIAGNELLPVLDPIHQHLDVAIGRQIEDLPTIQAIDTALALRQVR